MTDDELKKFARAVRAHQADAHKYPFPDAMLNRVADAIEQRKVIAKRGRGNPGGQSKHETLAMDVYLAQTLRPDPDRKLSWKEISRVVNFKGDPKDLGKICERNKLAVLSRLMSDGSNSPK